MPKSALKTSLHALTVSFADSVMAAIRSAPLEDLLGEAHRDSGRLTGALREREVARAPSSVRARQQVSTLSTRPHRQVPPGSRRPRNPAPADRPPPVAAAEITDPQGLLSMGASGRIAFVEATAKERESDGPTSSVHAAKTTPSVRLRANETLARVSNAGVVIRRGK